MDTPIASATPNPRSANAPHPPSLYDVSDAGLYWTFRLVGHSATVTITKPARNRALRNISGTGNLAIDPPIQGISTVPYGSWKLEAKLLKKNAAKKRDIRNLGHVLTVNVRHPIRQNWVTIPFAFHTANENPIIPFWIGRIKTKLESALKKPMPR